MILPAGVLLTKLDLIKFVLGRIDVYEACSLLMAREHVDSYYNLGILKFEICTD